MIINDSHCHFFSPTFFGALGRQLGRPVPPSAEDVCRLLSWDDPGSPESLADRWVAELDANGVGRSVLIASVPGDEHSVSVAVRRYPTRFVGLFMVDPSSTDAVARTTQALTELGLRGVCLFPAMHHVPVDDERTRRVVAAVSHMAGATVFVHCGALSVGVRRKLELASHFDLRLGNPLAVAALAQAHPTTPFIIPHFGAGLLRETLMAAEACANVYVDTSSSNGWMRYHPGLTLSGVFGAALAVAGPSRLLFGTDSSFFPRGWQRGIYDDQRDALRACGLPEADQGLVLGGNFSRLFE